MEFQLFVPEQADDALWREIHASRVLVNAEDWPEHAPPQYDATVARFRSGPEAVYPETLWLARTVDGELVATAIWTTFRDENPHLVAVNISVHPDRRGQGVGTAFLRSLVRHARRDGRTRMMGLGVQSGPDEEWATAVGFKPVVRMAFQQLPVAATDHALWDVPVPPGYRLATWRNTTPDDMVDSYARARDAMQDAVTGEMSWETAPTTPETIRQEEAARFAQGVERWTVAAVHDADRRIAGATSIDFAAAAPTRALQGDTSVAREYRGRGLGRVMKAAMLRRLAAERPEVTEVTTQTADFEHMARINIGLGYRTTKVCSTVEGEIGEVERTVEQVMAVRR